MILMLSDKWLS